MTEKKDDKKFRFSDDVIVYIRDIIALGMITKTDIVNHLRGFELIEELHGERSYLVPSEEFKKNYAQVSAQLVAMANKIVADSAAQNDVEDDEVTN